MCKFLGTQVLDSLVGTPYENFSEPDWVMEYIARYGQVDGSHHNKWLIDQIARILNGTNVLVFLAKWDNGEEEYRFTTDSPSEKYKLWRGKLDEDDYYDEGVAP